MDPRSPFQPHYHAPNPKTAAKDSHSPIQTLNQNPIAQRIAAGPINLQRHLFVSVYGSHRAAQMCQKGVDD
jgi:hypothetical protein